jgi:hypothetical protein
LLGETDLRRGGVGDSIGIGFQKWRMHLAMEGNIGARRTEDIALDLLKFIAGTTHVGTKAAGGGAVGFGVSSSTKPEDQVTQLLELYGRCRQAVEGPVK